MAPRFEFNVAPFQDVAKLQVTQILTDPEFYRAQSQAEFDAIRPYIDAPKRILELGCGLGRMSVFLNHHLTCNPHFILADADALPPDPDNVKVGWDPGEVYYNDLGMTAEFARAHGLTDFETFDIRTRQYAELEPVDLIMSFLSVGFHYPIEHCIDQLMQIIKPNGIMLFGVRKGAYTHPARQVFLHRRFAQIQLDETQIAMALGGRSKEGLLVLQGPKLNA